MSGTMMMVTGVYRIRVAYNNFQPSVDWSKHETRGNERTEAQQSEYEGSNPTGCATASRSFRYACLHTLTMHDRLPGIKQDLLACNAARRPVPGSAPDGGVPAGW
jgi:hypothetical protein